MSTIKQLEEDLAARQREYDEARNHVVQAEKDAKLARERLAAAVDCKAKLGGEVMRLRQAIKTLKAK